MAKGGIEINETTDRPILEELNKRGNLNPIHISEAINRHRNYVVTRLKGLEKIGLVTNLGHGLYQISEKGKKYLNNDLEICQLEE